MPPISRLLIPALFLGLLLSTSVVAQDVPFEHFTVDDGLLQNSVRAIMQDRLGFLWFGTQNGLVRYDGYRFVTYQHDPDDTLSLSHGDVFVLHEDRNGAIWVGTRGGLNRFDRRTETFTRFMHDPNDSQSVSGNWISFLHEDQSGQLWLLTKTGARGAQYLDRFDPKTGTVTRFRHDPDDPGSLHPGRISDYGLGSAFLAFCEDREGHIWIGLQGDGGLNRFDPETETFAHFLHDPNDPASLSNNGVNDVYEDRAGNLWIATYNGLNRMDRATGTFTWYPHDPEDPDHVDLNRAQFIYEDRQGILWVATRAGFVVFDRKTAAFTRRYLHNPDDPDHPGNRIVPLPFLEDQYGDLWFRTQFSRALSRYDRKADRLVYYEPDPNDPGSINIGTRIEPIFEDRSGVLWIGTWGGGLNKLDRLSHKFPLYRHDPYDANSLSSNSVRVLYESPSDPNVLWIGTDGGGLNRLDRETGRFTHYRHDPNNPHSLSSDRVGALLEDRAGRLWIGTVGGGLNRLDRETGRFTRYRHDPNDSNSLSSDVVWALYEDPQGVLWVGARGYLERTGLQRLDPITGRFIHLPHEPYSPPDNHIYVILGDQRGGFWVGTNMGGVQQFDSKVGRLVRIATGFDNKAILSLLEDRNGRLWIGSFTDGLGRLDSDTGTRLEIPDASLRRGSIHNILRDDKGYLWISSDAGLSKVDPDDGVLKTYDTSDGLPGNRFTGTAYRGADGTMYFGGENGFIAFHPEQVQDNAIPPPVALTDFRLFDEPVPVGEGSPLTTPISVAESITLRHDENDFSFGFSALHYRRPEKNQYAYMLVDYDVGWREVGTQRRATYMNLDPGAYTFRVKASNSDGVWNEDGASIRVIITPPWWRTTWAYLLYGLLFIAGIVAVDRIQRRRLLRAERERARIRAAEERAEVLAELDQLKTRFFVNVSHEFRTPLTLILGPLHDALDGVFGEFDDALRPQLTLMQRNGARLLRLINQLLDLSKLEAGSMTLRARRADLVPFLRRIVGIFASRAERKDITLRFSSSTEDLLLYFEADKLEKVFVNLISNAFKFTPEHGEIRVEIEQAIGGSGGFVEVVVRDTGQGIPADDLPLVFDRFHQVEASMTRDHEGTGIGLALVKELVALHGGTVRAESEVGVGTAFIIRLPQGSDHLTDAEIIDGVPSREALETVDAEVLNLEASLAALDAVPEIEPSMPPHEDAPLVLVVEDNPDVRAYLRSHLAPLYRVEEAEDGVVGLEMARAVMPALVICDVMMPRMDGYELCRALKTDEALNHIPVVLLTAKADEKSKVEGLETGADDYLYKPFNASELLVRAENLIEIRRLLRQRFSKEVVLGPSEITIPSAEAAFLKQVRNVVEAHMADSNFGVDWLADEVGVSTRHLQRKLKDSLNLSPSGYIRTMRLERAAQLLEGGVGNVSEVAYAVGFQDLKHFSKLFRQVFGVVPSQYAKKAG